MSQSVHQFDPTIGLWLSPDPMADDYPGLSPFVYCAADPVNIVDPEGEKIVVREVLDSCINVFSWRNINGAWDFYDSNNEKYLGENSFINSVKTALLELLSEENGAKLIHEITNYDDWILIESNEKFGNKYFPGSNSISWLPNQGLSGYSFVSLGHELAHSLDDLRGTYNGNVWISKQQKTFTIDKDIPYAEIFATHYENLIRKEHGIQLRRTYLITATGKEFGPRIIDSHGRSLYFTTKNNTTYMRLRKKDRYKY